MNWIPCWWSNMSECYKPYFIELNPSWLLAMINQQYLNALYSTTHTTCFFWIVDPIALPTWVVLKHTPNRWDTPAQVLLVRIKTLPGWTYLAWRSPWNSCVPRATLPSSTCWKIVHLWLSQLETLHVWLPVPQIVGESPTCKMTLGI